MKTGFIYYRIGVAQHTTCVCVCVCVCLCVWGDILCYTAIKQLSSYSLSVMSSSSCWRSNAKRGHPSWLVSRLFPEVFGYRCLSQPALSAETPLLLHLYLPFNNFYLINCLKFTCRPFACQVGLYLNIFRAFQHFRHSYLGEKKGKRMTHNAGQWLTPNSQ